MSGYDLSDCADLSAFADLYRPELAEADPATMRDGLIDAVRDAIATAPRSLQREIGPSELGTPCNRKLAFKFAGVPSTGLQAPKWRAAVGSAVHDHFSDYLHRYNEVHGTRYITDQRVWVGDLYPGRPITGELDAYDCWTATVIDLKVPGKTSMDNARKAIDNGPQYDVQLDSYGVGAIAAGLPVRNVGILRLPASGELTDALWKVRPHDPERAARGLARAGGIARLVDTLGPAAIPMQPATEWHCGSCEWFRPGATDLTTACPGAESFQAARAAKATPPTPSALLAV